VTACDLLDPACPRSDRLAASNLMARKRAAEAKAETQRAHEARLQYLSRNLEFCKAIRSLSTLRDALPGTSSELTCERQEALQEFVAKLEQVASKWEVPWFVLSQLSWHARHENRGHKERIPSLSVFFDSPVIAWRDALPPVVIGGNTGPFGAGPLTSMPENSRYLNLRVDLDHPVDTLLPLIEKELGRYSREHRRGRRRPKQVDFYLSVFDLAESGETFRAISLKLKKPQTTVKSAYLTARRKIGSAATPSKKDLPLASFDKDTHTQNCSTCRKAQRLEEMCKPARIFALQDHESQRELTGRDPVR
jgi:hypothetical protein